MTLKQEHLDSIVEILQLDKLEPVIQAVNQQAIEFGLVGDEEPIDNINDALKIAISSLDNPVGFVDEVVHNRELIEQMHSIVKAYTELRAVVILPQNEIES